MALRSWLMHLAFARLTICVGGQHLSRVPPIQFEQKIGMLPLALVLLCAATQGPCAKQEAALATAAGALALERSSASLLLVDLAEPGGDRLRTKFSVVGAQPVMVLFRHGRPTPYTGGRAAGHIQAAMRDASTGRALGGARGDESARRRDADGVPRSLEAEPAEGTAALHLTSANLRHTIRAEALLVVMFYSADSVKGTYLLANFTG